MFTNLVSAALSNLSLTLFVLAMILTIVQWSTHQRLSSYEILFRWTTLLPLGLAGIYGFAMHGFFPEFTAHTIGWSNSPFQFEVAVANLGFGMIGLLAYRASYGFRLASVIGNTCWLWGDATGHIYQMITKHNFANGNAGSWFWMDLIIPMILIICMVKLKTRY
ncbi:MAG: hypothetical protein P4M14_10835 [Gammaproteobacteria bacterium]|nr:hypothetical protein [Gammaproteobacteria bacterium]